MVNRYWEDQQADENGVMPFALHEDDRKQVRDAYLEALARAPPLIRVQLCAGIRTIVRSDFPTRWFNVFDSVVAFLNAGVENAVSRCLLLFCVYFCFESSCLILLHFSRISHSGFTIVY